MIRTSTKKVAVPLAGGFFREITIELEQHYHDNTKKLQKTEEKSRTEGRLLRKAPPGEKASVQLMDAETFEVLSLVEAPEGQATAAPEKTEVDSGEPPAEAPAEAESAPAEDEGNSEEDDMAQKKSKAAAKAAKKTTTKKTAAKKTTAKKAAAAKKPAAKKPAAKKAAKKAASKSNGEQKDSPSSGQSGPPVDLSKKALNAKEAKVLAALCNGKSSQKIAELAAIFKGKAKSQANSWVRNSLRRLVRGSFVEQVERGTYKATAKGKKHQESTAKK
jgi:hypothetical protein